MQISFINEIILLVVAAFLGGFAARIVKLPPIVGCLVGGIVFGVIGKIFFSSYENLFHIAHIGIALFLFTLGFEVSIVALRRLNKKILYVAVLQLLLTAIFLLPVFLLFHLSFQVSLLFALLCSFSSSAVILKLLAERGLITNFPGNSVFTILLLQDLLIVPIVIFMPFLFDTNFQFPGTFLSFFINFIKPVGVFMGMYIASKFFFSKIFPALFRAPQQELAVLATILIAVVSVGVLMYAGLPLYISSFFAGVLVAEEGKKLTPFSAIKPIRDILLLLFFVLVGMFIDGAVVLQSALAIIVGTISIVFIKFLVLFFLLRFFSFLPSANIFISSHLTNIGEFAVVIAQIALVTHFIGESDYQVLLAVFAASYILIPVITNFAKWVFSKYKHTHFLKSIIGDLHYFAGANFKETKGHVIIVGHGRVGEEVRNLLDMGEVPYVVVDYDKQTIDVLMGKMKNGLYGDPADIGVLKSSGIEKAKILVVALPDGFTQKAVIKNALKLNPGITILCRSHIEDNKYELVNLGVNTIVIPEFEAGLRIGKKVLELLGFSDRHTLDLLRKLRKFHFIH